MMAKEKAKRAAASARKAAKGWLSENEEAVRDIRRVTVSAVAGLAVGVALGMAISARLSAPRSQQVVR